MERSSVETRAPAGIRDDKNHNGGLVFSMLGSDPAITEFVGCPRSDRHVGEVAFLPLEGCEKESTVFVAAVSTVLRKAKRAGSRCSFGCR